jgi:hypothetical protein
MNVCLDKNGGGGSVSNQILPHEVSPGTVVGTSIVVVLASPMHHGGCCQKRRWWRRRYGLRYLVCTLSPTFPGLCKYPTLYQVWEVGTFTKRFGKVWLAV